jgi:shikimate kinase
VVKSSSENAPQNKALLEITTKRNPDRLKKRPGKAAAGSGVRLRRASTNASDALKNRAVFLVGFMGAGKSSVGRALGQRLNWVFEDLDDRIEQHQGRTVAEIFRNSREPAFRRMEHAALRQVLEELRGGLARIVALGGGAFVEKENAALLNAAGFPTVFLEAPVDELWRRCNRQASETGAERPLLKDESQFRKLHETRRKSYLKASLKTQTGNRTVDAIAAEIIRALALKPIASRSEEGEAE